MFTLSMEEAAACGVDSTILAHLSEAGVPNGKALLPSQWAPRGVWGRHVLSVWCTIAPLDPQLLQRLQFFALSEAIGGLEIIEGCIGNDTRPRAALSASWEVISCPVKQRIENANRAVHDLEMLHQRARSATSALLRCEQRGGTDAAGEARVALALLRGTLSASSSVIAPNTASAAWLVREAALTIEDAWDELGVIYGRPRPLPDDQDGAGALILQRFIGWLERKLPVELANPLTHAASMQTAEPPFRLVRREDGRKSLQPVSSPTTVPVPSMCASVLA